MSLVEINFYLWHTGLGTFGMEGEGGGGEEGRGVDTSTSFAQEWIIN